VENENLKNTIRNLTEERQLNEGDQKNSKLHMISNTEFKIGNIVFNPRLKIGPGSTGNMVFKGKVVDDSGERVCAVKKIPIIKKKDLERAQEESRIMK